MREVESDRGSSLSYLIFLLFLFIHSFIHLTPMIMPGLVPSAQNQASPYLKSSVDLANFMLHDRCRSRLCRGLCVCLGAWERLQREMVLDLTPKADYKPTSQRGRGEGDSGRGLGKRHRALPGSKQHLSCGCGCSAGRLSGQWGGWESRSAGSERVWNAKLRCFGLFRVVERWERC